MGSRKTDQISQEAQDLLACVTGILDNNGITYKLTEGDQFHSDTMWYQITIMTRPEADLRLVLYLFRDAIEMFWNDYEIFIYLSEQPSDFQEWIEHLPAILSAVFRTEIRIRGRWSLLGKKAAILLELPEGAEWMGDEKACKGLGREYIFRNWF